MEQITTLFAVFLVSTANAQLVNGSFEVNGGFSLQGWEWTCGEPQGLMDAPTGGGSWSATKEPGQAKGCFPSYLFQRLPGTPNGSLLTVTGWLRCPESFENVCLGAFMGFGSVHSNNFQVGDNVGTAEVDWQFMTFTDTIELAAGDTAIVLLNSGFIGGPVNPLPGYFDNLEVEVSQSISERTRPIISHYPDPVTDVLHVGSAERIERIVLFDGAGKLVRSVKASATTEHLTTGDLPAGEYVVSVLTVSGEGTFRFVKR